METGATERQSTRTVADRVIAVAKEVLTEEDDSRLLDASLRNELAMSSLERLTLFVALEDEFQRNIAQEEVEGIDTIRDVIAFIEGKLAESHE